MKIAYADCFSGVSGDMFLGALLDCGLPENILLDGLALLSIDNYHVKSEKKKINSLGATKCHIEISEHQPHRTWKTIRQIIKDSSLTDTVKEKAQNVFELLARAEAGVHGCSAEDVHFHEVGGVDAIIDIVGTAIGLDYFAIKKLICSPLPMTRGWVKCAHGDLPLPTPAVCEILKGVPVYGLDLDQELVTPTGAVLVTALSESFGDFPPMTIAKAGYGAGSHERHDGRPNLLRLIIGESSQVDEAQEVEVIETHLDDWSPEGFPYLAEQLFRHQALDVAIMPIQMKKGRPGFMLRVISEPEQAWELKKIILMETTAIGLRYRREKRWTLPREKITIPTRWGDLQVKKVETPESTELYPEYEECCRIAREFGVTLKSVYAEVNRHDATKSAG